MRKNSEDEETVGIQEDIPDTKGGNLIEGQGSGEEIARDKDCSLGIEFPFDEELLGNQGKMRAHLTQLINIPGKIQPLVHAEQSNYTPLLQYPKIPSPLPKRNRKAAPWLYRNSYTGTGKSWVRNQFVMTVKIESIFVTTVNHLTNKTYIPDALVYVTVPK